MAVMCGSLEQKRKRIRNPVVLLLFWSFSEDRQVSLNAPSKTNAFVVVLRLCQLCNGLVTSPWCILPSTKCLKIVQAYTIHSHCFLLRHLKISVSLPLTSFDCLSWKYFDQSLVGRAAKEHRPCAAVPECGHELCFSNSLILTLNSLVYNWQEVNSHDVCLCVYIFLALCPLFLIRVARQWGWLNSPLGEYHMSLFAHLYSCYSACLCADITTGLKSAAHHVNPSNPAPSFPPIVWGVIEESGRLHPSFKFNSHKSCLINPFTPCWCCVR